MRRRPSFLAPSESPLAVLLTGLSACLGLGLGSGCGFDPGHDYAVTTTWLLNGATPDATRCKELGIEQFELRMDAAGPPVTLRADCDEIIRIGDLTYGGFETTRSFDYGIVYHYTVDAIGTDGEATHRYEADMSADYGDAEPVDLDTVDIFEPEGNISSYSAGWVFSDGDLSDDCARNQVSKVELWMSSATDPSFYDAFVLDTAACDDGEMISKGRVLARGDYYFMYVALDDRGAIAEQSDPISVVIEEAGDVALPRHQFEGL